MEVHLPSDESEGFFTARGFLRKNDENDTTGAIILYADVKAFKHAEEAVAESEKWEDECFKKEQDFPKNLRVVSVEYYGGEVVDFKKRDNKNCLLSIGKNAQCEGFALGIFFLEKMNKYGIIKPY